MITPKNNNILNNEDNTRKKFLKKILNIINIFSIILIFLIILYPKSELIIWSVIIFPIIGLIIIKLFIGFRFIFNGMDYYGLMILPFFLMVRNESEYYIIHDYIYIGTIISIFIITFIITILFIIKPKSNYKRKLDYYFSILVTIILLFNYSYGLIIFLNCNYNNTKQEHFISKVLNKEKHKLRYGTQHHIIFSSWGDFKETQNIIVNKTLYNNINIGDNINIYSRKGRLSIPWYTIEK